MLGREREEEALKFRLSGLTYRLIAAEMGISESGAYKAVIRALRRLNERILEQASEVRRMELERLDKMLRGLWFSALKGHQGAIDRVLRIMQRRAMYLGLDAPKALDVTTGGEPLTIPQPFEIALRRAYDNDSTGQISEDGGESKLPAQPDRELPAG